MPATCTTLRGLTQALGYALTVAGNQMKALSLLLALAASQTSDTRQFEDPEPRANANYEFSISLRTKIPTSCVEANLNGSVFVIGTDNLGDLTKKMSGSEARGAATFESADNGPGRFCSRVAEIAQYSPDATFVIEALRLKSALLFRANSTKPEETAIVQFVSTRSSGDMNLKFAERNLGETSCVLAKAIWWLA